MLYPYVAAALALASTVVAQAGTILDLPQCGQQAILAAIQTTGCSLTDVACICNNQEFVGELVQQIPTLCSAEDIALTAEGSAGICIAYGVEIDIPDLTGGNATTSGTSSETTGASASSSTTSAPATTSGTETSASQTSASGTSTPTESSPAATQSGSGNGAASNTISLTSLMGAGLLGVVLVYL